MQLTKMQKLICKMKCILQNAIFKLQPVRFNLQKATAKYNLENPIFKMQRQSVVLFPLKYSNNSWDSSGICMREGYEKEMIAFLC